ncbi:hypothetical protein A3Q56_04480 [Intoshia linei]|uniref:receptor protein-tyrosine kinase n=1 Tax=Intoshia linei TaxID=1819745 RepID=A0A177B0Y4_9BILA|nr:hypothetical protein A3Q56_04480 [Intoshia linei]
MPLTEASVERAFSKHRQFHNYLRENLSTEKLNDQLMMITERAFIIKNTEFNDTGLYECTASNYLGIIKREYGLEVTDEENFVPLLKLNYTESLKVGKPRWKYDMEYRSSIAVNVDNQVLLSCEVEGIPKPNIKWLKDSLPFYKRNRGIISINEYTLTMNNVDKTDQGYYTCVVSNKYGSIQNEFIVYVLNTPRYPPTIINEFKNKTVSVGQNVTMECSTESLSAPYIAWIKDATANVTHHTKLTEANSTSYALYYVLTNVTYQDAGKYVCFAANTVGSIVKPFWINVVDVVLDTNIPRFTFFAVILSVVLFLVFIIFIISYKFYSFKNSIHHVNKTVFIMKNNPSYNSKADQYKDEETTLLSIPKIYFKYKTNSKFNPVNLIKRTIQTHYIMTPDKKWEIPRNKLDLVDFIGNGAFGKVFRAKFKRKDSEVFVAVKMLKDDATEEGMRSLVQELELMKMMDQHENIISLIGACTENGRLLIIMECADYGNLKDFLTHNKESKLKKTRIKSDCGYSTKFAFPSESLNELKRLRTNSDQVPDLTYECELSLQTLTNYAIQIARGMNHFSDRKWVHRDLATRNILICQNSVLKIADFGLSRNIEEKDYYLKNSNSPLPLKWMAPESISNQIYTLKTDIWSYGVVLWEIFTLGATPYENIDSRILLKKLLNNYRLKIPLETPKIIQNIIKLCWNIDHEKRPLFSEVLCLIDRDSTNNSSQFTNDDIFLTDFSSNEKSEQVGTPV